ncbi:hypothetical protein [Kineosporia sp. R_H_3]|uniref:hypothetical protein n=1 Tax=Kineosporia sp. R_H_3 TaxID=1961848 RepID=UPI00117AE2AC|nr:hypothetical protein [Kineosporia sp. R_H_3]
MTSAPYRHRRSLGMLVAAAAAALSVTAVSVLADPAGAAVPTMSTTPTTYAGAAFPATATSPSADKPQSKLWFVDNTWWGLFTTTTGVVIRELQTNHTWADTGVLVDSRVTSTADALWQNGKLSIVSRTSSGTVRYYRYSYAAGTRTWSLDAGFPASISTTGARTATIAIDSNGIVWTTFAKTTVIYVSHSTTAAATAFTAPVALPVPDSTVTSGDLSGIIAFGANKVGVLWSDQETAAQQPAMRFAYHVDGDPDTAWTVETVYQGTGVADNHVNLKTIANDAQGRVFAVVKTSFNVTGGGPTADMLRVLSRSNTGVWSIATLASVSDGVTRPQIAIDQQGGRLYALYTGPEAGGTIYYKSSPLDAISFPAGKGSVFMESAGAVLNNVSLMRDMVSPTTGLVAIASDDTNDRYYHAELSLQAAGDTSPPTAVTAISAVPSGTTVNLTWSGATDNVGIDHFNVYRNNSLLKTVPSSPTSDAGLADGTYTYGIAAVDAAGNVGPVVNAGAVTISGSEPPAGTIAFVSGSTASVGPGTSLVVNKPAGTVQGQVMVATVSVRGNPTITAPAGWTQAVVTTNSTTMRQAVFTKPAGASEPATYTFSLSQSKNGVVQVDTYSGVSTTTPVRSVAGQLNASSSTISAPSVSATAGDQVLGLFSQARSSTVTPNTGLTKRLQVVNSTGSSFVTEATGDRKATVTGLTGVLTTSANGSAASIGQTLVLRAA